MFPPEFGPLSPALAGASILLLVAGCGTLDRAYDKHVIWMNAPVVRVVTNTVVAANIVAHFTEQTNLVLVTNAVTGTVSG